MNLLLRIAGILSAALIAATCSDVAALTVDIVAVRMERADSGEVFGNGVPTRWRVVDRVIMEIVVNGRAAEDLEEDTMDAVLMVEEKVSGGITAAWRRVGPRRFNLSFEIASSLEAGDVPKTQFDYGEGTRLWLEVSCLRKVSGQPELAKVAIAGRIDVSQYRPAIEEHLAKYRNR